MNDQRLHVLSCRISLKVVHFFEALSIVLLPAGCLSYAPQQLSSMPDIALCELQLYSLVNLDDSSKARLQDELRRRNADCRAYAVPLEAQRAEERARAMAGAMGP